MNSSESRNNIPSSGPTIVASESLNRTIEDLANISPELIQYKELLANVPEGVKGQVVAHLTGAKVRIAANEDRFHSELSKILQEAA